MEDLIKHAYILMLAVFFCLTGCGEQTKEVSEKHLVPTGIMVPAAETKSMAIDITDAEAECLLEESFFYASRSFVEDAKGNKTAKILFCRKELADFEEEQILLEQHEGSNVRRMTLDSNANLYELVLVEEEGNNIKQDIDILTRLVNSSHVDNTGIDDTIFQIICEESGAFFAGDKTAEETAQIIQNRVQLYLEEKKN